MQPQALGRGPLSCHEFLEGHSDYLDGLLPDGITWRFDEHAAECSNCNRFDRVLRRGLLLARNLPEIQPSATFQDKLQARLMGLEAEPIQRPVIAGTGTAVVIAAVLGMVVVTPFLMQAGADHAPAPTVAESPQPSQVMPSLQVSESAFGEPQITAGVFATPPFETSYSPVIVQAPAVAGSVNSVRVIAYPLLLTADQMKPLTPDALHRHLAGGKRGGVYFVYGDEEFLKEEATSTLVDAHLDPATRDFNYDQLRADDTTPETMALIIATPPMMAEWRVVVVRDVQAMGSAPRLRTTLETLLERPIPGLLLILTAEIPSGRAQFYENLKKKSVPVECVALSEADLPGWLMERARSRGFELRPEAARLAAGNIGSDLGVLLQELNKLYELAGEKRVIDKAMVSAVVVSIARQNRWEWFDLVADRKFQDARRSLDVLLDSGENGVGLVIGLGTQFLRLAIGVAGGQRALEEMLPPHQKWLAGRIARQTRGWSLTGVEQALDDLLRADRLLKSTPLSDVQVLEELLLRLQTRAGQVAA